MALRWKKFPPKLGLSAVGARPQGSELHDGTNAYATVYPHGRSDSGGWYWVARFDPIVPWVNTCNDPPLDQADAKAAAMAYVRECLAKVAARPSPPREKQ